MPGLLSISAYAIPSFPLASRFIADAVSTSPDTTSWVTTLISTGALGIGSYLLATGKIVPKSHYDDARRDAEESRTRELALYREVMQGVMPAIRDSAQAVAQARSGGG